MSTRQSILVLLAALAVSLPARADVLSLTDVMPGTEVQAKSYAFTIENAGTYLATLIDLGFPSGFDGLSLGIAKTGGALVGKIDAPGDFSFTTTAGGAYTALVFGQPTGLGGSFSIDVAATDPQTTPVPEPSAALVLIAGLGFVGVAMRRRMR